MGFILRKLLGLTWHKLSVRPPPVLTQKNQLERFQTAQLMLHLRNLGFILVFLDEYAHNDKSVKQYGWARPGSQAFIVHANRQKCI